MLNFSADLAWGGTAPARYSCRPHKLAYKVIDINTTNLLQSQKPFGMRGGPRGP